MIISRHDHSCKTCRVYPLTMRSDILGLAEYIYIYIYIPGHSSMPAYHCSSSSSAPRNRSSPAIRKVPRQMAAVKMRTRNQRPRLLTVLRSRRATRPPLSWTAKLIPRSMCLSRDGNSWRSQFPSSCPRTIDYYGT